MFALKTGQPSHIHNIVPQMRNSHRHPKTFHVFPCRTDYFFRMLLTNLILTNRILTNRI